MTSDGNAGDCPNCGAPLTGRYCAKCGQEQSADPTVRALLAEWAGDLFDADSRLWRTLRVLFTRPGLLSVEHRVGRRARYLPPTRLYLIASVAFFSAVAFAPVQLVRVGAAERTGADEGRVGVRRGTGVQLQTEARDSADEADGLGTVFERGERDTERLNDIFVRSLAWVMFLLIPIFAALLELLFRDAHLLYVQHLVFALHYHAFAFLTQAVGYAAMHLPIGGQGADAALLTVAQVANAVYLYVALRRFYATGRLRTFGRMAVIGFGYVVAVGLAMLATVAVAMLLL